MLYDMNNTVLLLGCFCKSPYLISQEKYYLDNNDDLICSGIEESHFYSTIYRTLVGLVNEGATEISGETVDLFLQRYPQQLSECEKFGHIDFINNAKELAVIENIDFYFASIKKFSLLRKYKKNGFDISPIYDELKDMENQNSSLSKYSIEDIINHFSDFQTAIKHQYLKDNFAVRHHILSDNIDDNIESYKNGFTTGLSFSNEYLNSLSNGFTGLTLRSGSTGAGKSMLLVADACKSGCEELFDIKENKFVHNSSFVGNVLFINSELEFDTQIQPMFLAYISNVERNKIRHWELTKEEEQRVLYAKKLISSHLFCVDIPDFTVSLIEETIDFYVHKYNIKLVCFDYVSINNSLANEVNSLSKINNREDSVLLYLTRRLKEISLKHKIPILSGTQLNRSAQTEKTLNEASLAGGISQLFKCDNVFAIKPLSKEDKCDIEPYYDAYNLQYNQPTHYIVVLKARDSRFPKFTRIYERIDLGTGREEVLFCTDSELEPLQLNATKISFT